ncbi:hypothetical protein Patl1_35430 [Pistacia atlantica]|nr:hypothetical protein Patl1_35430 [Pistacia atlantica]
MLKTYDERQELVHLIKAKEWRTITFDDNSKGKIIGIGSIGNKSITINDVLLVDGLKHNLLSISQLSDKGFKIILQSICCEVVDSCTNTIAFIGYRHSNVYIIDLCNIASKDLCLMSTKDDDSWLWHRRLGHASMDVIAKLSKKNLVYGLPKLVFKRDHIYDACAKGNHKRVCFKSKNIVSTSGPL